MATIRLGAVPISQRVRFQRVRLDQFKTPASGIDKRTQNRAGAKILFHRNDMSRTLQKQRAGQSSGAQADLDRRAVELPGAAGNPAGQVQIEQEILPQ